MRRFLGALAAVAAAIVLTYSCAWCATSSKCMSMGYEGAIITADLHRYCYSHNHSFGKLHRYYTTLDGVIIDE